MVKKVIPILLLIIIVTVGVTNSQHVFYVAPGASGSVNGTSSDNAAFYLNVKFWQNVQDVLQKSDVMVFMSDGTYNLGTLTLNYMGNPVHKLTIKPVNQNQVVMSVNAATPYIINMRGTQNTRIEGIAFTGDCKNFAVACWTAGKLTARNIEIIDCRFENLPNAYYGGLYLAGADNILVEGCTFNRVGSGAHAHMIYSDKQCRNLTVINSTFTDSKGDYVRFRNDTGYAKVDGCTFLSTGTVYNHAFILIPVFNDVNPGDEFLATDFQFTNNVFEYRSMGGRRHAVQFHVDGYNVPPGSGLDYWTSVNEGKILNFGSVEEKEAMLNHMGLYRSRVHVYGNTYKSVERQVVYWHHPNYGSSHQGYTGYCNISDWPSDEGEVDTAPVLINGDFEMPGFYLRYWNKPDVLPHKGLNGTGTAVLFDRAAGTQELFQWLNNAPERWTMEGYFAIGETSGSEIVFRIDIGHNELDDSRFSVAVNKRGEVGVYDNSVFYPLPQLGSIEFSVDSDGNNRYNNESDQLYVYRMQISGNYSVEHPAVDISLSKANQTALTQKVTNLNSWVGKPPVAGMRPAILNFLSNSTAVIVDELKFENTDDLTGTGSIKTNIENHQQLLVYPNPAVQGRMQMKFYTEMGGTATATVYSLTGEPLIVSALGSLSPGLHEKAINLDQLPQGVFFLRALVGKQTMNSVIVVP